MAQRVQLLQATQIMPENAKKQPKKQGFSMQGFDVQAYKQTESYVQAIDMLYNQAINEFSKVASGVTFNPNKPFAFADYPAARNQAQSIVNGLATKMQAVIVKGSRDQWLYACKKNDAFLAHILNTSKVPKKVLDKYQSKNLEALDTFQNRKSNGMDLSKRIWNYTGQMKDQMEQGIDIALGEGKSAADLSRDLRKYLVDPDKLFHKVNDKHGKLHMSKNAKAFHPGQGKYRSSYKNAMRLTRTEINMAYRESDWLRWQQLDFIIGFDIKLSNNHTTLVNGIPEPFTDICDDLEGRYPKSFKWTAWHPQCRCHMIPVMMSDSEMSTKTVDKIRAAFRGEEAKKFQSPNTVKDVPQNFKDWVSGHAEVSKGWNSSPYWIKDNFTGGTLTGGLKVATIAPKVKIKAIKTDVQKAAIQSKWSNRVLRKKYAAELNTIDNKWYEVNSIIEYKAKIGQEILKGTDPKVVDGMMDKLRHKIEVKKSWDALKPIKVAKAKANALLTKTTKMTSNLVAKAEAAGYTGADLEKVKQLLNTPGVTNAELNKAYGKLNSGFKVSKTVSADPFSKEALLKTYTQEEVDGLFKAYDSFYAAKVTGQDIGTQTKKLNFEIEWLEKNGKYKTSGVLKKILERDLANLKNKFELDIFKKEAGDLIMSHKAMKDKSVVDSIKSLEKALKDNNLSTNELKTAIGNANAAIKDYNLKNVTTVSPDDFKFFENEGDKFSITKLYTETEKSTVKQLREKLKDATLKNNGNIRNDAVCVAQQELAEYMYDIQFKYASKQQSIKHIGMKLNSNKDFEFDYITDAQAKAAYERYINGNGSNYSTYSNNVGGQFMTSACKQYTNRVKNSGVNIEYEATLPTRYFSGSSFINGYIGKTDLQSVMQNKLLQESLHDYVGGLSYSVNKLPRHNGVTYRGINYSQSVIDDLMACKASGKPFVHQRGISTSLLVRVADSFSRDITMKIYGRSGVYSREFSAYSGELEVLYRPGSRFEVLEVYQETTNNGIANNGRWTVVLKEILK